VYKIIISNKGQQTLMVFKGDFVPIFLNHWFNMFPQGIIFKVWLFP